MLYILYGFFGWMIGAFVNYLSDVLPTRRKLVKPFCAYCNQEYNIWNYLVYPRQCPNCNRKRPLRIWVIEILYIGISLWLYNTPNVIFGYWGSLILLAYFGVVVIIDIEHRLILHPVSLAGVAIGAILGTIMHGISFTVLGGVAGFLIMLALYYLGGIFANFIAKLRGEELNEVALGFGDVNLAGVIGLLLGWPGILGGLFLAILIGGFVSLAVMVVLLLLKCYRVFTAYPYGPYLVISAIFLLYFKGIFIF